MLGKLLRLSLPMVPRPIVGRVAKRYVAGATREEGLAKIAELNSQGLAATLALLGEEISERSKADCAVDEYVQACQEIERRGLDSGVSIKLTLLGLKIDEDFCREHLDRVAAAAAACGVMVRIDMEDHSCTDATLRLYREAQQRHGNLGLVLQSYLRRSVADAGSLPAGTKVRLCKGIYVEPRSVAYQDYDTVRVNFLAVLERLLDVGAEVAVATHDEYLVGAALGMIQRRELPASGYEFQTLLGVDEQLREILRDEGHRVRVYIPYGVEWYEYSMRRLRENPKIAVYVLRAVLGLR